MKSLLFFHLEYLKVCCPNFATLGLELESLKVKEIKTGKIHEVNAEIKTDEPGEHSTSQNEVSDTDTSKVEQILYLLINFCQ